MKSKKNFQFQTEILNKSQLSVQQLHQELKNNPSLINYTDNNGETIFSYALKNNNFKIYDLLLNSPFLFLNYQDKDGNSYLHLAVKNKNEKIIKNLIDKGININLQNKLGNTALHLAYEIGNPSIIKKLVDYGININIKNKEYKKAEEIKKKLTINKNQSYNILCKKMKSNKSTTELKITSQENNVLKSQIKNAVENRNNNNLSIKENGGIYEENIRSNLYTGNIPKYYIKKNTNNTEIKQNDNIANSEVLYDKNKNIKEKFNIEKFKKGSLYKIFSLKENNIKEKDKEEIYEEEDNNNNNKLNKINKEGKIIFKKKNQINNSEESSFSFLVSQSSESRKRNNNNQRQILPNEIKSINEYECLNNKDNHSSNKKKKNNKRSNYRNSIFNLSSTNNIDKWNTIQMKNSPRKINKNIAGKKAKHKSITKRNSPRKNTSFYSNKIINKTINTSRSKKKSKIYKDSLIINKSKKNQIQQYENQLSYQENKVKTLDQKEYMFDDENYMISNQTIKSIKKNSIISINKIVKRTDENILTVKTSKLLRDFLSQINMGKYIGLLTTNGFDDINLILEQSKNGGASIQDNELKEAGISKPGDRAKILIRIQELSNNFSFPVPKEIYHIVDDINDIENDELIQKLKKWLENLKVDDYLINFIYSGYHSVELLLMQMISDNPLTSEILKEEIGIDKIGYRSRIINKLKDEARSYLGQLKTKTLVINKGEENTNNCQCFII